MFLITKNKGEKVQNGIQSEEIKKKNGSFPLYYKRRKRNILKTLASYSTENVKKVFSRWQKIPKDTFIR